MYATTGIIHFGGVAVKMTMKAIKLVFGGSARLVRFIFDKKHLINLIKFLIPPLANVSQTNTSSMFSSLSSLWEDTNLGDIPDVQAGGQSTVSKVIFLVRLLAFLGVIIGYYLTKRSERILRPLEEKEEQEMKAAQEQKEKEEAEEKRKQEEEEQKNKEKQASLPFNTSEEWPMLTPPATIQTRNYSFYTQPTGETLKTIPEAPLENQENNTNNNAVIIDETPKLTHAHSVIEAREAVTSKLITKVPELASAAKSEVKSKPWLTKGKTKSIIENNKTPEGANNTDEANNQTINNTPAEPMVAAN